MEQTKAITPENPSAESACAALRASDRTEPAFALISAGDGQWSQRSRVGALGASVRLDNSTDLPAFFEAIEQGEWVGCLEYELGALLEPAAGECRGAGPFAELWRSEPISSDAEPQAYRVESLSSSAGEHAYTAAVRHALEYIAAGDVYQVNLTHQLRGAFTGDARALAADAIEKTGAWFGAYLETPTRSIVSASPELLVRVTPDRRIVARPIKGTRPLGREDDLLASAKDAAELAMIVDLMRNDLGRVCAPGSVRVDEPRSIEGHAGVAHTVATVSGALRDDTTREDILRAVFPAGSITGAPKIRAMQIIRELEPEPRGAYCGSIVRLGDDGSMDLSVAIRTAVIRENGLRFGVGAGIVADSNPAREWRETLDKAAGFAAAAGTTVEGRS